MKLTAEQRIWIGRQMWPAAEEAAKAFVDGIIGEMGTAINCADFAPVSVALAIDCNENEFVIVTFSEGNDNFAESWLAEFLMDRFPGLEIQCRTEW